MHVEKFPKTAVGHMLCHYNRTAMNYGNEKIDHLRSDLNYNLAPKRNLEDFHITRNDYHKSNAKIGQM